MPEVGGDTPPASSLEFLTASVWCTTLSFRWPIFPRNHSSADWMFLAASFSYWILMSRRALDRSGLVVSASMANWAPYWIWACSSEISPSWTFFRNASSLATFQPSSLAPPEPECRRRPPCGPPEACLRCPRGRPPLPRSWPAGSARHFPYSRGGWAQPASPCGPPRRRLSECGPLAHTGLSGGKAPHASASAGAAQPPGHGSAALVHGRVQCNQRSGRWGLAAGPSPEFALPGIQSLPGRRGWCPCPRSGQGCSTADRRRSFQGKHSGGGSRREKGDGWRKWCENDHAENPRAALHIPALVRGREVGVKPDGTHGSKDKLLCASVPQSARSALKHWSAAPTAVSAAYIAR